MAFSTLGDSWNPRRRERRARRHGRTRLSALAALAAGPLIVAGLSGCDNPGIAPPSISISSVEITSPLEGFSVLGNVNVWAAVESRSAPDSVVLFADGTRVATDTAEPWRFVWPIGSLPPNSEHILEVIAYDRAGRVRSSAPVHVTESAPNFTGDYGLFTINADGSNFRQLDTLDVTPRVFPIAPDVSPDGLHIVFTGYTADVNGDGLILPGADDPSSENFVVDDDGLNLRQLSHNQRTEEDARWADGTLPTSIYYSTDRAGSDLEIFQEEVLGGALLQNRTQTTGFSERYPEPAGDLIFHSRFAAGSDPGPGAIWTVHRITRSLAQVTAPLVTASPPSWLPVGDLAPDVSPDGTVLVFCRSLGPGISTLGDVDIERLVVGDTTTVSLSSTTAADLFPRWSPDGGRIVIVSWAPTHPNGGELELVDPVTGTHVAIGPLPAGLRPVQAAWFPDALPGTDHAPDIVFTAAREDLVR